MLSSGAMPASARPQNHAQSLTQTQTQKQVPTHDLVILFDVDNTLLDSDRFKLDLNDRLERDFGSEGAEQFWQLHGRQRQQQGYADHLGTVQAFRAGREHHPQLLQLAAFLLDYPFAQRLFPQALQVLRHVDAFGLTVILTEGDMVYQPHKVQCSGIWAAVAGRVMIPLDKRAALSAMQQRYPAAQYVLIEDKPLLLAAAKQQLGRSLTTIFVRQGHYANEADGQVIDPPPDLTIAGIGDLLGFDRSRFMP